MCTNASTHSADSAVEVIGPVTVATKASKRRGRDARDQYDDNQVASRRSISMTIGEHEAVNEYLTLLFETILQQAMKHILKCWIRAIESKKQTNFPYVKGHHPDWWPEGVRYKEPDHQLKHGKSGSYTEAAHWLMSNRAPKTLPAPIMPSGCEHATQNFYREWQEKLGRDASREYSNNKTAY